MKKSTSDNRGYAVRSRSPKPLRASHTRNPLSEMPKPAFEKGGFINILKVMNMGIKS